MTKADFQAHLAKGGATEKGEASNGGGGGRVSSKKHQQPSRSTRADPDAMHLEKVEGNTHQPQALASVGSMAGSNPRNTAAGVLRSQNPLQSESTRLSFMAYQLLRPPVPIHGTELPQQQQSVQQQPLYVQRSQYDSLQCLREAVFDVSQDALR
jgi:hypothetical protein